MGRILFILLVIFIALVIFSVIVFDLLIETGELNIYNIEKAIVTYNYRLGNFNQNINLKNNQSKIV